MLLSFGAILTAFSAVVWVTAQRSEQSWWVYATAAGLWIAGMGISVLWARRIRRTIDALGGGAKRIAGEDFEHRVFINAPDELADLARKFNEMSGMLSARFNQLEEDRQKLRAILSGMVEGVIALDPDQRILFANDRAAELLEFQPPAAVGRLVWEVFRQRPLHDLIRRALSGPEPCEEELTWTGARQRFLKVHAAPLSGSPARGSVLVLHDTTALRRLEQVRREFVANVSHELKTPLAVIRACAETLMNGAVDDLQHREGFLDQITEQSERLNSLILDLLTLNRIEAGTEIFDYQAVALDRVAQKCVARHRARAETKQQALEMIADEANGTPVQAWADEEAVEQIVDNLMDNAVKYTPHGGRIRIRWWERDGDVGFEVQDTGIGISERDLPRVFERFYRVDKARSRELGGTGLGLSIVKHLTQAMHGTVSVMSQIGVGSTFSVRLPRAPAESEFASKLRERTS